MVSDVYETRDELPAGVLECIPMVSHIFGYSVREPSHFYFHIIAPVGIPQMRFGIFSFTWNDLFSGEFFNSHNLGVAIIYHYEVL
jgi:hypothetical protein